MRFLLLNQTFYPDVMATGQYLADLAQALEQRGHQVTVVASRRAYDDPHRLFPKSDTWRGIRILRVGSTGFGKTAKWRRAADFASFLALSVLRLASLPRHDVIVALTSPPLISFLGACAARLRRSRFVYWVMDFNPDEALAAGWLRAGSLVARVLDRMSRFSLKQAARVIALDRFMRDRIMAKGIAPEQIVVVPPWAQDHEVHFDLNGRESFRSTHALENKYVVMYSGNHSPCHPLDTLLEAARRLADDPGVVFCFIGGGTEWRKIRNAASQAGDRSLNEAGTPAGQCSRSTVTFDARSTNTSVPHRPATSPAPAPNLLCLPYQPLSALSSSLSAADLHVVVMGDPFVGLVHPCKIYNILAVGARVLYIGPTPSHVTEILASRPSANGWFGSARHGEVEKVLELIQQARAKPRCPERGAIIALGREFSSQALMPRIAAVLEAVGVGGGAGLQGKGRGSG